MIFLEGYQPLNKLPVCGDFSQILCKFTKFCVQHYVFYRESRKFVLLESFKLISTDKFQKVRLHF